MDFVLNNVGNTCYFNTGIQCLLNCPGFLDIFKDDHKGDLFASLKRFVSIVSNDNHEKATINNELKSLLKTSQSVFKGKLNVLAQNDLCEFILLLFDSLNEGMKNESLTNDTIRDICDNKETNKFDIICMQHWIRNIKTEYNTLNKNTSFLHISQIKCQCSKTHNNYEFNNNFQLDIQYSDNLYDCIRLFMRSVYLNCNDKDDTIEWKCDVCNKQERSKRVNVFWKLPKILIIFLKRFILTGSGFVKLNKTIDIPLELDMNKYALREGIDFTYSLKSVGCHIGRINFGHYYSVLKKENEWVLVDDDNRKVIENVKDYIDNSGYMLIYELNSS